MRPRPLLKIGCLLIFLSLGLFGLSSFMIEKLHNQWMILAIQLRQQGWDIASDPPKIQRCLWGFRVTLPQKHFRHSSTLNLKFSAINALSFNIPFNLGFFSSISFTSATPLHIYYENSSQRTKGPTFTFICDQIKGHLNILRKNNSLWLYDLEMTQACFQNGSVKAQASHLSFTQLPCSKLTVFRIQADAQAIQWTPTLRFPFFNTPDRLALRVRIDELDEVRYIENFALSEFYQALVNGNATIEVEQALFQKGDFEMDATGTVSLDQSGQPLIALSTRLQHIDSLLQDVARHKILPQTTLQLIKFFLLPLQQPSPPNTTLSVHQVPLTVQEGVLSLGPFPLMTVPQITWKGL